MKPLIIAIIGKSGSGKTTAVEYIEKVFNIPMIQSWTDRPKRFQGEIGHTFVSTEDFDVFRKSDMIAFTQFGGNRYCCLKTDVKALNTYVIDEAGIDYLEKHFKNKYFIKKVFIKRDKDLRVQSVGADRIARDKTMYYHDEDFFDVVIENNSTEEELFNTIDNIIGKTMEEYKEEYRNAI